jgi:hypothetical protein
VDFPCEMWEVCVCYAWSGSVHLVVVVVLCVEWECSPSSSGGLPYIGVFCVW